MVCELESYRWDAILLSETWRHDKSEIWETHHKHILMGAGKYDNKHGVRILVNKKWRQTTIDAEYINKRAITTTIVVNHQRIKPMSVYFSPLGVCRPSHRKSVHNDRASTRQIAKKYILVVGGDFNAELGPGDGNRMHKCLADTHSTRETKEVIG